MSDLANDTDPQDIQPNTWTPLLGTDMEILIDGIDNPVQADAETFRTAGGDVLVQLSFSVNGAKIALRAPT